MMLCAPMAKSLLSKVTAVAGPPFRVTGVPIVVAPSEKVTVPLAVYPAPEAGERLAVMAKSWPGGPEGGVMPTVSVVGNGLPVRLIAVEVLEAQAVSPG